MYKCKDCGQVFEEPDRYMESRPIGAESFCCCPVCQNSDFEKAYKCKTCDDYIIDGDYCDGCVEYIENKVELFNNSFTEAEYELLEILRESGRVEL